MKGCDPEGGSHGEQQEIHSPGKAGETEFRVLRAGAVVAAAGPRNSNTVFLARVYLPRAGGRGQGSSASACYANVLVSIHAYST